MGRKTFWTDDRVLQLRSLIDEGKSFSIIGDAIGCTRNAAIGKALRLGISTKFAPHSHGKNRQTKVQMGYTSKGKRDTDAMPTRQARPKAAKPADEALSPPVGVPETPYQATVTLPSGRQRVKLPPSLAHDEAFEWRVNEIKNRVSIGDIPNIPRDSQCKWIYGDPKWEGAHWCRKDVERGYHYCPHHNKLMYQPRMTGGNFRLAKYPQMRK